jgi:hypothetical protein
MFCESCEKSCRADKMCPDCECCIWCCDCESG